MNREQVRDYLQYYRDLGFESVYRRPVPKLSAPVVPATSILEPLPLIPPIELPSLAPENDTLDQIRLDIGDCKRCRLCEARKSIVFGVGNERSP